MGNIFSDENDEEHEEQNKINEEAEDESNINLLFNWFGGEKEETETYEGKKKVKNVKFDDKFTFDDDGLRKPQSHQKTRKRKTGQKNRTKARRY